VEVWTILDDPVALRRVLPGCESLVAEGPSRFRGVFHTHVKFLTLVADVVASLHDADPPRHVRLTLEGRPRSLAASFTASIPVDLEYLPTDGTRVSYRVDLTMTGRLATFGAPLLRKTFLDQVAELVRNVQAELAARRQLAGD